ncbi:hypothetical protein BC833DRAFT_530218 [Globomyces pollinis-pini]|nr:hypothetical protein BC833DRAFT_530218 [Globomyces pollinis-pini]
MEDSQVDLVETNCCSTAVDSCCSTTKNTNGCCKSTDDTVTNEKLILYASQSGTSKRLALELKTDLNCECISIDEYENESFFKEKRTIVFILSNYQQGTPSDSAKWFFNWLQEARYDVRVGAQGLLGLKYVMYGVGDSSYGDEFCSFAKKVDKLLAEMAATRVMKTTFGDINDDFETFNTFKKHVKFTNSEGTTTMVYSDDEQEETYSDEDEENENYGSENELMDIEDMGNAMKPTAQSNKKKEMVTPKLRQSLEKQKYKIVGTHSGVKVCRWTKSMLRGRGGCYKHSFYGIESHRCMETTPSLACANRCVFCWRSHTNPVGTTWKWKMDDYKDIVAGAMEGHYKMINELKGVPGVKPERFKEAMQIRHCALSLVGEPIMYPQINELVGLLHEKRISSFLVTNAQFPDEIKRMVPCTQLYVSIDAGTKESLYKVDRPVFKDFWERYLACLDALKDKGQRTVYRLTLVKDFNTEEIPNYGNLISRGTPDFVEVKGVTYCGFSGSQPLTMKNVPYHVEVANFCEELIKHCKADYEIACVHEHSCSVLIARKKFKINNKWHTWIDYEKFHDLVASGESFTSMDYIMETPSWAVYGAKEQGFDPNEVRYRKGKLVEE